MDFGFPVEYPNEYPKDLLLKSTLLKHWAKTIDPSISIKKVKIVTIDLFPGPRIGLIEMDVTYSKNNVTSTEKIILSGGSVTIVPLIQCYETKQIMTMLVKQPRIAFGGLSYEFPAGMVDDSTDFELAAIREFEEECGFKVSRNDLIDVGKIIHNESATFYNYSQFFDEFISVYIVKKVMTQKEIKAIEGRNGGIDEDEQITQHIVPFDDVCFISQDGATLGSAYLVKYLIEANKINLNFEATSIT